MLGYIDNVNYMWQMQAGQIGHITGRANCTEGNQAAPSYTAFKVDLYDSDGVFYGSTAFKFVGAGLNFPFDFAFTMPNKATMFVLVLYGTEVGVPSTKLHDYALTINLLPATHTLNVASTPSGIIFTLWAWDKGTQTTEATPYSAVLEEGNYILDMPESVIVAGTKYFFGQWTDGSTARWRGINLRADLTYNAVYVTAPPSPPATALVWAVANVIGGVLITVFALKG